MSLLLKDNLIESLLGWKYSLPFPDREVKKQRLLFQNLRCLKGRQIILLVGNFIVCATVLLGQSSALTLRPKFSQVDWASRARPKSK